MVMELGCEGEGGLGVNARPPVRPGGDAPFGPFHSCECLAMHGPASTSLGRPQMPIPAAAMPLMLRPNLAHPAGCTRVFRLFPGRPEQRQGLGCGAVGKAARQDSCRPWDTQRLLPRGEVVLCPALRRVGGPGTLREVVCDLLQPCLLAAPFGSPIDLGSPCLSCRPSGQPGVFGDAAVRGDVPCLRSLLTDDGHVQSPVPGCAVRGAPHPKAHPNRQPAAPRDPSPRPAGGGQEKGRRRRAGDDPAWQGKRVAHGVIELVGDLLAATPLTGNPR